MTIDNYITRDNRGENHSCSTLSESDVWDILKLKSEGFSIASIAQKVRSRQKYSSQCFDREKLEALKKVKKMQTPILQWLNDNGVLISSKLASAIAAVEFHNGELGLIDKLAGQLIKELVEFTKESLQDEDNFYNENDKAGKIYNLISENCASLELQDVIDEIEDRLHKWQICDEIDCLIVEVIACTVQCFGKVTP